MAAPSAVIAVALTSGVAARGQELRSPDGRLAMRFSLIDIGGEKHCPVYELSYAGQPAIRTSRLGLQLRDFSLLHDLEVVGQNISSSDTTWRPVTGERESIRDRYNQLAVELRTPGGDRAKRLTITFRAYDAGLAFSYTLPRQDNGLYFDIVGEPTQFAFAGDFPAWPVYAAQGDYAAGPTRLSQIQPGAERPFTVQAGSLSVSIAEARIADYARMKLRRAAAAPSTLEVFLDAERNSGRLDVNGEVTGRTPFTSPWRVVMVADSPARLLEQNDLLLNLNDPQAIADTSWIKPGKVIRDVTLTTAGGKACIDFAVKHNLQYVELDAGWYGPQYDPTSDARAVAPARQASLNLQEVIDYGKSRGIGVILYVNHVAMEQQLDEILPLYEKWGVKGVKFGFVTVGSQFWTALTHEAIRKAAAHHLMVDIHDEFRNMGYQRTYPNLMTVEGIRGNEEFPTPVHNAILPFTRFLAGPADYTYCWNSPRLKVSKAHQLALSTIFFSPWQFLYWYDTPQVVSDEPALAYWDHLPVTWDETRVLQGDIGRRVAVARRKGAAWFVGAIAPSDGKFALPLSFLAAGTKYKATVYSDKAGASGVQIDVRTLDSQSVFDADIPAAGGLAIELTPVSQVLTGASESDPRLKPAPDGWNFHRATITDSKLPRVLLIGDSILGGYKDEVIALLQGKANVDYWENPYFQSEQLNQFLVTALSYGPYDVVHFNMGLHGWQKGRIKEGTFEPLTRAYIAAARASLPEVRLIWASSTPVTALGKPGELDAEINPVIVEQNRMAAEVMAEMRVPVDDLYARLIGKLDLARGDQFHWKAPAYTILAGSVSESILRELTLGGH